MKWEVEYTDKFGDWWAELSEEEQVSVAALKCDFADRGRQDGQRSVVRGSRSTADRLYEDHLRQLREEGLSDD